MNIIAQICGLILLTLLVIFHSTHKTLGLYKEKIFISCVGITIIGTIIDILYVVFINLEDKGMPDIAIKIVCKTYLCYLILIGWSIIIYILGHFLTMKKHKFFMKLSLIPVFIAMLPVILHTVTYTTDGVTCYSSGPAAYSTYIVCGLEILIAMILGHKFRKSMEHRTFFAVSLYITVWIAAAVIQLLFPQLLLVSFASAVGMIILHTLVDTTEYYLDKRYNVFNSFAMMFYIEELKKNNESFGVLEFSFEDSTNYDVHRIEIDNYIKIVFKALLRYKDVMLFKNIDLGFLAVSNNSNQLHEFGTEIIKGSVNIKNLLGDDFYITYVESTYHFSDLNDLFKFFSICHKECDYQDYFMAADEQLILRYKSIDSMKQEIDEALTTDRFECFLQPIYSFERKSFIAAEALCRMRNPDGSIVPPSKFIRIAEDTGQIIQIGEAMFESVCNLINKTSLITLGIEYIEINLSVVQCEEESLADRFINLAKKNNVNPKRINFEITESAAIRHKKILERNMQKMIDFGFSFSLDDFGKGESNLMYIVEMPVSIVKIDYDLTKEFFRNQKAKQVLRAVVAMVHSLNLKLVVEGIEDITELEAMEKENGDYIQGYYFSKPLPVQEFISFIANYSEIPEK